LYHIKSRTISLSHAENINTVSVLRSFNQSIKWWNEFEVLSSLHTIRLLHAFALIDPAELDVRFSRERGDAVDLLKHRTCEHYPKSSFSSLRRFCKPSLTYSYMHLLFEKSCDRYRHIFPVSLSDWKNSSRIIHKSRFQLTERVRTRNNKYLYIYNYIKLPEL